MQLATTSPRRVCQSYSLPHHRRQRSCKTSICLFPPCAALSRQIPSSTIVDELNTLISAVMSDLACCRFLFPSFGATMSLAFSYSNPSIFRAAPRPSIEPRDHREPFGIVGDAPRRLLCFLLHPPSALLRSWKMWGSCRRLCSALQFPGCRMSSRSL